MSKSIHLYKNYALIIGASVCNQGILFFVFMPYLKSRLGYEDLGNFSLIVGILSSISLLLNPIADLPFYKHMGNDSSHSPAEKCWDYLRANLKLRIGLSVLIWIATIVTARVSRLRVLEELAPYAAFYVSTSLVFFCFRAVLLVSNRIHTFNFLEILQGTLNLLSLPIAIRYGLPGIFVGLGIVATTVAVIVGVIVFRSGLVSRRHASREYFDLVRGSIWHYVMTCVGSAILLQQARWTVGLWEGEASVGQYSALYTVAAVFQMPFSLLVNVLLPMGIKVKRIEDLPAEFYRFYSAIFKFGPIAMIIGGATIGVVLIQLLYGPELLSGQISTYVVLVMASALYVGQLLARPLAPLFIAPKTIGQIELSGGVLALVSSIILIPQIGILGAAVGTALGCLLQSAWYTHVLNWKIIKLSFGK